MDLKQKVEQAIEVLYKERQEYNLQVDAKIMAYKDCLRLIAGESKSQPRS